MPTPLEILLDPISLGLITMFLGLFIWETLLPAKPLPKVKGWYLRSICSFVVYFYLASYLPIFWDQYLIQFQFFNLENMNVWVSTLIALIVFELLLYAWHLSIHRFTGLWRAFHQMHHSAERVDVLGAFYFSPLDMIGFTLLGSLALVVVIGVSPQAATYFLFISQFLAVFQHCNIRTPHWLGYIIQRPESHNVHHGKGIHHFNYSDLPIIDMLFGTFRNPREYDIDVGFYVGASARVKQMMMWKDVSKQPSN